MPEHKDRATVFPDGQKATPNPAPMPSGIVDDRDSDRIEEDNLKWKMHGGLHLRQPSTVNTRISTMPVSRILALALEQPKLGSFRPLVRLGDSVKKFQVIARSSVIRDSHLHAPSSGTVVAIEPRPLLHPSRLMLNHLVIETDGYEHQETTVAPRRLNRLNAVHLSQLLNQAGVVGHGGGHYPSGKKLTDCCNKVNHILVVNACECDPWIKCDHALMLERAEHITETIGILRRTLNYQQVIVGIESNTPDALDALKQAGIEKLAQIKQLSARYPIGNEKQLIYAVCGKKIGLRDHPSDVGIVCLNVGTVSAIGDALLYGRPVIDRLLTVGGGGIAKPHNLWVRIGSSVRDIVEHCGGLIKQRYRRTLVGGKMTGFELPDHNFHILRNTNALMFADQAEAPDPSEQHACIQCDFCQNVCPAELQPQRLLSKISAGDFTSADVDYHLFQCMECGCCDQVCPSHIPLTGYFRYAKGAMRQQTIINRRKNIYEQNSSRHLQRVQKKQELQMKSLHNSRRALTESARQDLVQRAAQQARDRQDRNQP